MSLHNTLALDQLEPESGLTTAKALEMKDGLKHVEQAQKNPAATSARGFEVTNGFASTRQRGRYSWSTAQTFTIR